MTKRWETIVELCDWVARHQIEMSVTVDEVHGEPVPGPGGQLYANPTPGDMHVRIDFPRTD